MSHPRRGRLQREAWCESGDFAEALKERGLGNTREGSPNFLASPGEAEGSFFRRAPNAQRASTMEKQKREAAKSSLLEMPSEEEEEGSGKRSSLPYPKENEIKILGLTFDRNPGFSTHIANIIAKTSVRQNVFRRVGGCTWGAEATIMRETHKALMESVVSYGLVATGPGAYGSELRRLDTCTLNPAARATAGAGSSARLTTLHSTAGTISIRNLYIQSCARPMDRGLRAGRSSVLSNIRGWSAHQDQVKNWDVEATQFCPKPQMAGRLYASGYGVKKINEEWTVSIISGRPETPAKTLIQSVYYSTAKEIEGNPQ